MQIENSTNLLQLVAIKDPFNPEASREIKTVPFEGKTVQDYIGDLYPTVFQDFEVVASVNGKIVDPALTVPPIDSYVVFCLSPGGGSNMTRMLAMLAVVVVSWYMPGWVGATTPFWKGATTMATLMAGTLLINAVLPVTPMDTDDDGTSSSYAWSSLNAINEGSTYPVIYGTIKTLPYLIGKYSENIWIGGARTPDKQRLNLLYLVADHAVDTITDIKLNGNDYDGYDQVSVDLRYGANDQAVISNFRDTHTQQGVNIKFTHSWHEVNVPGSANTGIGVGVSFPQGLFYQHKSGDMDTFNVHARIQYSLQSEDIWTDLVNGYTSGAEVTPLRWGRKTTGLPEGAYKIRFYTSTEASRPPRLMLDQYLDYVEGIVEDDFRYPGSSLLAVNAIATDQLSGGLPAVSCVVSRNTVPVWTGSGWEDKSATNPAWACYDMLVDDEYGGGVPYSRMTYSDFATWASFCTANNYTCNIVIDVTTSFPEALAKISILGRGHIIQRGTNFGVIIDKADTPVQLFGLGQIVEGSFKQSYIGKKSRANSIAVTYFDASQNYERLSFELRTSDFDTASSVDPEKLELVLYGASSKELAVKHAKFLLNCNEYLIRFVEFEVDVDSLASNVGDIIYVSHDIPQWGYSGHIVSATSNTVTIDREVTLSPGTTYHILVRHYDDDDLEEVALTTPGVETTTDVLNLLGTWAQIPQADDVYAFGEIDKVAKEFRITNISRSQQMRRGIQALEYRSEVYSDDATIPDYEPETDLEPYVNGLRAVEVYRKESGLMVAFVALTWRGFGLHYLYMKEEEADRWSLISTHAGDNWAEVRNLESGKTYIFAVSTTANPADGSTTSITFKGWTAPRIIWDVIGLQVLGQGNNTVWQNRDLKLTWNLSTDSFPDAAGDEVFGAGTFPPMTEFGGYRVRIQKSDGSLRREFVQFENYYNYTLEVNSEDGNGTPVSNLVIQIWARDKFGEESESPASISVSNPAPAAPSGLSVSLYMKAIKFFWGKNTEIDFDYYKFRTKVATDAWSDWSDEFEGTETFRSLTQQEQDDHTTEAQIYIEVKAYDTFGNESLVSSTNATTSGLNVQPTDINDFAITASKIFTKIPILEGDSWTNNSPSAGSIAWNTHTLYHNGVAYSIEAGNSSSQYIYWINGSSSYTLSDTNPTLTDVDFLIATNDSGSHDLAWNAMANLAVGSAYIQEAAILGAHILELDADKIRTGTLTGIDIIGNTIRTSTNAKCVVITNDGIRLQTAEPSGKYGQFVYGSGPTGEKYGSGALAFIHHTSKNVPFYISTPTNVGDFHHVERTALPTGSGEVGDVCVVNGIHYTCTGAGVPGTWTKTGTQT